MTARTVRQRIRARDTADGAGVKLRRSLGQHPGARLDPFLMLDEFYSDDPGDYIAGFPSHPHRGFETVTYMLAGHMLHEDHLGNRGDLKDGGAGLLLLAGRPLGEPVVQYGPFVMNSEAEIEQALKDYRDGVLAV